MSQSNLTKIKVVLLGDGGVGKTTLVTRHRTGEFVHKYNPTMGVEVHPLQFNTNNGRVVLNCWDTAGQEKFGGLREGYYGGAKHFIVFFDLQSKTSFKNAKGWISDAYKACDDAHVTLVGMKCDIGRQETWKVTPLMLESFTDKYPQITLYYCSAKSNYNFKNPFLRVIRDVMGDDTYFVESDPVTPPEVPSLVTGLEREESDSEFSDFDDDEYKMIDNMSETEKTAEIIQLRQQLREMTKQPLNTSRIVDMAKMEGKEKLIRDN